MTQHELAGEAGVDLKTVYNLESGTRWPIARTRVAVSAALKWPGDALAALLAGRDPVGEPEDGPGAEIIEFPVVAEDVLEHLAAIEDELGSPVNKRDRVERAIAAQAEPPLSKSPRVIANELRQWREMHPGNAAGGWGAAGRNG